MNIKIKLIDGSRYNFQISNSETCLQLKRKFENICGFSPCEQRLLFENNVLDKDDEKLIDCGVSDGCEILCTIFLNKFDVIICVNENESFEISVERNELLDSLRHKIQSVTGIPVEEQVLFYKQDRLDVNQPLFQYGIIDRCVIVLVPKLKSGPQIFAKTMDGKKVAIEIQKIERVSDMKKKIQKKIGLAPDEQKLIFQGGLLEDDKTADEYQITENSVINVVARLRGGPQIFAKTMDGKIFALEIQRTDRVSDIKKKIQEKIGLAPEEQKLVFQGGMLEDDKTADEYQIVEKSVINVVARLRNGMQIFAKTMDGETFPFEIQKTERVCYIKKKIQEKIGLAPDEQKLVFQGRILEDDKTADEYQIREKSVINVVARLRRTMLISAKTMDEKTVSFRIQKTERVCYIKKQIQERIGLASDEQKLVFQGGILEDDKTVDEYQIEDNSVIKVVVQARKIFIKAEDGETASIDVSKTDKIRDVKIKIQDKIKLDLEKQNLIYKGTKLNDNKTIEEYQITEESVIDLKGKFCNIM